MITICLLVFCGASLALAALVGEALYRLSTAPPALPAARPGGIEFVAAERRTRNLPYVGQERRAQVQTVQIAMELAEARRAA